MFRAGDHHTRFFLQRIGDFRIHRAHGIGVSGEADHTRSSGCRDIDRAARLHGGIPDVLRHKLVVGRFLLALRSARGVCRERQKATALCVDADIHGERRGREIVKKCRALAEEHRHGGRAEFHERQVAYAALADAVELADADDHAIVQFDADGILAVDGEDVDHAAAHGEFGWLVDAIVLVVTDAFHGGLERLSLQLAASDIARQRLIECSRIRQQFACGFGRRDEGETSAGFLFLRAARLAQRSHARANVGGGWRLGIARQCIA